MKKITIMMMTFCLCASTAIFAADGTWNVDADGDWSTNSNWTSDTPADGAGNTANFTYDITAERAVTLDSARTIGNINFADGGGMQWINFRIIGGNTLTLDNSGATPVVDVTDLWGGFINVPLAGTAGFNKTGTATERLILDQDNTISGTVTVQSGLLTAYNNNALKNADVNVNGGVLEIAPNIIANFKSVTATSGDGNTGLIKPYPGYASTLNAPLTASYNDGGGNTFVVNVDANSGITLNSNVTMTANTAFAITGNNGTLNINAPVSGAYSLRFMGRASITDIGTFNINAPCTYTGNTVLQSWGAKPRFEMGVNNALPCGDGADEVKLFVSWGNSAAATVTLDLNDKTQQINKLFVAINAETSGQKAIITGSDAGVLEITNVFTTWEGTAGASTIELTGGKIIFNGPYFGLGQKMVITNATLIQNGGWGGGANAEFILQAGAKIGGTGFYSWNTGASVDLVIPDGATITPGNSIGTLGCWNLEMQDGSEYDWEVGTDTADMIDVRGGLDISDGGITVNVIDAGSPDGRDYTLATTVDGITGPSNNVTLVYGTGVAGPTHPRIVGNNLVAAIIPEPATLGFLALLGLAFLRRK